MRRILHISDIHFGPPHRRELSDEIVAWVERDRPDLVVVAGDLTQRAKPEQFREAREFVDRLASPWIAVPGNHDVPMYRFWERLFARYRAYRRHFDPELEPVFEDEELFVVGVNTAYNWTIDGGRMTGSQVRRLATRLADAPDHKLKIVVAHHDLVPPPRFDEPSVMANAEAAMRVIAEGGAELVLSGHRHQAYVERSDAYYPSATPPVLLVHSGTTSSDRGRGSEKAANSCFWIETDASTVLLSERRWDPSTERFLERSRRLHPRRTASPYALEPSGETVTDSTERERNP